MSAMSARLPESAADISKSVRNGTVLAAAITQMALDRMEAVQPALNSYISIDRAASMRRAEEIDRLIAKGADPGPLAGVPVAVKDLIDQAGQTTTAGSGFYRSEPTESAACISLLEASGAVMVGRTGLHEFAFGFSSENEWFGPVRNPWDTRTSPGGSSGGSAVTVAAGVTPLAIGTDTGGSVRVPAAMCGIYGLKVTHGRVSLRGVMPLAGSVDTVGPFARSVVDLRVAYKAIAGYDALDPWSAPSTITVFRDRPATGLRIGIPEPWVSTAPMTEEVQTAFSSACDLIQALGHVVTPITIPDLVPPGMITQALYPEAAEVHRAWWESSQPYGDDITERLVAAFAVSSSDLVAAERWRTGLRNSVAAAFEHVDLLITPGVAALRKEIGVERIDTPSGPIAYRPVLSWFSALVNQLRLPSVVGPVAQAGSPPPSIQVIGPWWSEELLLDVMQELEDSGILGFRPPPPILKS